jgi:hypothetical protein
MALLKDQVTEEAQIRARVVGLVQMMGSAWGRVAAVERAETFTGPEAALPPRLQSIRKDRSTRWKQCGRRFKALY